MNYEKLFLQHEKFRMMTTLKQTHKHLQSDKWIDKRKQQQQKKWKQ